jgi:prepilin-type N-terminal cleavage/methylation domain-containing protein
LTTGPNANRLGLRLFCSKGMSAGTRHYSATAGFTLLELVLVMVVICTVLAMAAPSLRGFFASRGTNDAATQIVALTQLARSQAITEGRVYRLNMDVQEGTYWLTVQEGGAFKNIYSEFGRVFSLPRGTVAEWESPSEDVSPNRINFYPDGRTEASAIRLIGLHGDVVEVICLSPTELFQVSVPEES